MRRSAVVAFLVGATLGCAFVAVALLAIGAAGLAVAATIARLGIGASVVPSLNPPSIATAAPLLAVLGLVVGALWIVLYRRQ